MVSVKEPISCSCKNSVKENEAVEGRETWSLSEMALETVREDLAESLTTLVTVRVLYSLLLLIQFLCCSLLPYILLEC